MRRPCSRTCRLQSACASVHGADRITAPSRSELKFFLPNITRTSAQPVLDAQGCARARPDGAIAEAAQAFAVVALAEEHAPAILLEVGVVLLEPARAVVAPGAL